MVSISRPTHLLCPQPWGSSLLSGKLVAAPSWRRVTKSARDRSAPPRSAPRRSAPIRSASVEVDATQVRLDEQRAAEVGAPEIRSSQVRTDEVGPGGRERGVVRRTRGLGDRAQHGRDARPQVVDLVLGGRRAAASRSASDEQAGGVGAAVDGLGEVPGDLVDLLDLVEGLDPVRSASRPAPPRSSRRRRSRASPPRAGGRGCGSGGRRQVPAWLSRRLVEGEVGRSRERKQYAAQPHAARAVGRQLHVGRLRSRRDRPGTGGSRSQRIKSATSGDRQAAAMTSTPTARRLAQAVGVLLLTDLAGGLLAVAADVNTWADAWGGKALLAAPLPMIAVQVLLTWLAVRRQGRSRGRRRGTARHGVPGQRGRPGSSTAASATTRCRRPRGVPGAAADRHGDGRSAGPAPRDARPRVSGAGSEGRGADDQPHPPRSADHAAGPVVRRGRTARPVRDVRHPPRLPPRPRGVRGGRAGQPVGDAATWRSLGERWRTFATVLHHHHSVEDEHLWPKLLQKTATAGDTEGEALLHAMEAEHDGIDPALTAARKASGRWPSIPATTTATPSTST